MATETPEAVPTAASRPAPFPHHYSARVDWSPGTPATLHAVAAPVLHGGPPSQFGGRDEWWSPEHLLLSAVALCLQTTYETLAKKAGLALVHFEVHADGVLDKTREGLVFTRIDLSVKLLAPAADLARATELAHLAKRHCLVSNALKPPTELTVTAEPA